MNLEKEIFELSLNDIMPNRFQPREIFEDEALKELSESIKQHGIIQPIIVRKVGDKYEIIAGERRYRASRLAGRKTIPAIIRNIDDKEVAKVALLENLQRKDLSPIEEAKTYQTILKLDNLTQEELAASLGKSQSAVANKLRLLSLDEDVQTALLNNEISERHARSLLALPNERQKELLAKVINERLTVKQLDDEISGNKVIKNNSTSKIKNSKESNISNIPVEFKPVQEEKEPIKTNIFDRLRVDNKEPNINNEINYVPELNQAANMYGNEPIKYDLRFAINNFRQAIQNTEKFGFKVKTEEFENDENYQIIVTIKKKNE